jgi:hypothetical protein
MKQRIRLVGNSTDPKRDGSVVGLGTIIREETVIPVYLVELDEGFFNKDDTIWTSVLVVHRESLEPI